LPGRSLLAFVRIPATPATGYLWLRVVRNSPDGEMVGERDG